jgi:hypothetical protein
MSAVSTSTPSIAAKPMQSMGQLLLRLMGWRADARLPDTPKFVLVVYPHTSNWDVPIGLAAAYAIGLLQTWPYGFMIKAEALRWPVAGWLLRRLGGIGIDRRAPNNVVSQMVEAFERHDRLFLAITPEGTRSKTGYWKTGFYYIALQARVPIVLGYLDFGRKVAGLGPMLTPSGDLQADFEIIRRFYSGMVGKHRHGAGEIRLRPEEKPEKVN